MNLLFTAVALYLYWAHQYPNLYYASIWFLLVADCCYAECCMVLQYKNIQF